jgi:acyl-CoA carboxylase subunit beta
VTDDAIAVRRRTIGSVDVVGVDWDFGVRGGSFGEHDATTFATACADAASAGVPLVTRLRSGGTRLQEGMRALVGIPRAMLALDHLASAGLPHLAVVDHPTTGGVWVAIGSAADLRVGVRGATVGFSGARVVEAMTGVALPREANTAEAAARAGLLDAVVDTDDLDDWLAAALDALAPDDMPGGSRPAAVGPAPERSGWDQVRHSRAVRRPDGAALVRDLLERPVGLGGADGSVTAAIGRIHGRRACVVALAAPRATRVSVEGFRLLTRAARLAGRLDLALVTLVDTPGADPLPASEAAGIAGAIGEAMHAVLWCAAPTVTVVHGEGGSGGALAAAVTDVVGVTADGWFAALGPEGAAAALRCSPREAADLMAVTPHDLVACGFADGAAPTGPDLGGWLADAVDRLRAETPGERLAGRHRRWAGALPGSPRSAR